MNRLEFSSQNKILILNNSNGKCFSIGTPHVWSAIKKINEIQKGGVFLIEVLHQKGFPYEEIVDFSAYLSDLRVPIKERSKYFEGLTINNIEVRNK